MVQRFLVLIITTISFVLIAGGLVSASSSDPDPLEPTPISCPNNQTVILSGTDAPPNESLIAYLSTRPVGGGSSRQDGTWRLPLRVNERPGIYLVEVKLRGSRDLVASFSCYVDEPIEITETPVPEAGAGSAPPQATDRPNDQVEPRGSSASPTRTRVAQATPTRTPTRPKGSVTATRTPTKTSSGQAGGSSNTTATRTATRTLTPTRQVVSPIKIDYVSVVCDGSGNDGEAIDLINDGTTEVDLTGWKISNASQGGTIYTLSGYTLIADSAAYVGIYTGVGENVVELWYADFYLNRSDQIWHVGDQANLYNASGNLVHTYSITNDNCL